MSFRDELFEKIGADDVSKTPSDLLHEGLTEQQQGNITKAGKLFTQAFTLAQQKANETAKQQQYRNAAHFYYSAALAAEHLQQPDTKQQMLQSVAKQLLLAGNNYFDVYSEFKQGVICGSFAGLTYLLIEDKDNAQKIYESYIAKINQKNQEGAIPANAQKLIQAMWPIGYIIQALNETNHQALQDAQKYISTDIRPSLGEAKLIPLEPILDALLNQTLKKFETLIKLPELQIVSEVSNDIVLNQLFDVNLAFTNSGEGVAYSGSISLEADENLELVDGKFTHEFAELAPDANISLKFQFRYPSATTEDAEAFFKGILKYKDMLNNNHQQYIGPLKLHIAAISKKDKYGAMIDEVSHSDDELSKVTTNLPDALATALMAMETTMLQNLTTALENEEFSIIQFGIEQLSSFRADAATLLTGEPAEQIENSYTVAKEAYAAKQVTANTEALTAEKNAALDELSTKLKGEQQTALEELERKLNEDHATELSELKKQHERQVQMMENKFDRQIDMQLKEQFDNLQQEHAAKLQELNDKNAQGLQEIRNELQKDFNDQMATAKQECSKKYEAQILEQKKSFEETKRQELGRLEEDHKLRIEQMTAEFEKEKQSIIDTYSNQNQ